MADFKITTKTKPTSGVFFVGAETGSLYMETEDGRHICIVAKDEKIPGHIYSAWHMNEQIKPGSILTIEV